jgi:cupin superfamily acireductone dioxygenase involved in methionine salvage
MDIVDQLAHEIKKAKETGDFKKLDLLMVSIQERRDEYAALLRKTALPACKREQEIHYVVEL